MEEIECDKHGLARELALRESEERYRLLVESSPDAILVECEGAIVFANPAALRLFNADSIDDLLGRTLQSLAAPAYRDEVAAAISALLKGDTFRTAEEQALRLDGAITDVAVTRLPFRYRGKPAVHMVARDISERKRLTLQLHHQATHDALTGLPNRNLLNDRLHQAIADAKRYKSRFMVVFIDLDRFKWINDSFGHDAGDALLQTVSRRMSACLRESDTIARIGGDEFVLLLRDSGAGDESTQVLDRVIACVSRPMNIGGHEVSVTCSMGCCSYPEEGEDAETLLRFSDAAMYRAKQMGRNNMQRYSAELRNRFDERTRLSAELRHALDRGELALHYQLQIDLHNGAIAGLEALLRWRHPALGDIAPARFIPIAEETGMIEPITDWVLQQACAQNKLWQREGLTPVRVSVNLSARELRRAGLENRIAQCLSSTRLDPAYLELELTESASMDDPDKTLPVMHKLRDLGICLAIDDFGTGYSNMRYLQRFPVEKLKLDGSFTSEIATSPDSLAITDAIVSVAHRLGMKVVAEMTETASQVPFLAACGCDQGQGYYFSEPVGPDRCAELLRLGRVPIAPAQPG
jgi:diguanylate cyclase (GGDEF)-like protein/PAS domain S-box-containing protein